MGPTTAGWRRAAQVGREKAGADATGARAGRTTHQSGIPRPALVVRVRRNQSSLTKFQFSAFIDNVANGGERTGMSFTDEIDWPEDKNEAEFSIRIPECHLAPGKYIMDVWTSTGDILSSYKYYDCVYDTITFRIETYAGLHISEWHNYWGENTWKALAECVK